MAKAEEKKVVKPVEPKPAAEKVKPVVEVKPKVEETATEKEEKTPPPFGVPARFRKGPEIKQSEEVALQISALAEQDIENIPDINLNGWRVGGDKAAPAGSTLTIDGKSIEPIIKGVVGDTNLFGLNFFGGFDWRRRSEEAFKDSVRNAVHTWDVYVYKVKLNKHFPDYSNMLTPLQKKTEDNTLYQILVLTHGSSMELDAEVSVGIYRQVEDQIRGKRQGTLMVVESQLKNVIGAGTSLLHKQSWENVLVKDSVAMSTEYQTGIFKHGVVSNSILTDVSVYNESKYGGGNVIKKSKLNTVSFHNTTAVIEKSKVRDCMFSGKWCRLTKSNITGFSFRADKDIIVENTVMHNEYRLHLNANGEIRMNSIYDVAVMQVAAGVSIVLFNGGSNFWLNVIDDRNDLGCVVYKVAGKNGQHEPLHRRNFAGGHYGGPMPFACREDQMEHLDTIVRRAVREALGESSVSDKIAEHISNTFNERIGIARSIGAVRTITEVQRGYEPF